MKVYLSSERFLKNKSSIAALLGKALNRSGIERKRTLTSKPILSEDIDGVHFSFRVEWISSRELLLYCVIGGYLKISPLNFTTDQIVFISRDEGGLKTIGDVFIHHVLKALAEKHWDQYGFDGLFETSAIRPETIDRINHTFGPLIMVRLPNDKEYQVTLIREDLENLVITGRLRKPETIRVCVMRLWKHGYTMGILNTEDTVCIN